MVLSAIDYARALQRNEELIRQAYETIGKSGFKSNVLKFNIDHLRDGNEFLPGVAEVLGSVEECGEEYFYRAEPDMGAHFWAGLKSRIDAVEKDIRIYDVGPREQAQQFSSVARAANSLAIAASIAGGDPSSGAAAEAAANYTKQATGRAQAIERIPMVVGYAGTKSDATGRKPYFGWVFGPKAHINAKKNSIHVAHVLKAHDLSVDLIAPRWWPEIAFTVKSVWAPSASSLAGGNLSAAKTSNIRVPLTRSAGDYDAFTVFLGGDNQTDLIVDGVVSGCETTHLTITGGRGAWRTTQVLVMGRLIEGGDVSLLPSMDGVLVKVPPLPLAKGSPVIQQVSLLSPYGVQRKGVAYQPVPDSGECTPKKPAAATNDDAKATKFTAFSPERLEFPVPSDFTITVTGANLGDVDGVALHGQAGSVKASADGKSLSVKFTAAETKGVLADDTVVLEFHRGGKTIHSVPVRTRRSKGD